MSQFSRVVYTRTSVAVLVRMIGLISACATIIGVPTTGAFGNSLVNNSAVNAAVPVSKNEQFIAQRELRPDYRKYAQFFLEGLFGPPSQNFGPSRQDRAPSQNFNSSRAQDGRNDAQASEAKQKVIQQLRTAPPVPPTHGPLLLIVSIPKQTVTLYDAGVVVVQSPVSTGTSSNPTPTGIFSVIEKHWWHRSNLYSAAPMPFMQRITWEGVALHAGELPGYAASHGCIRLPYDFALRLWGTTYIGTRVIISYDDIVPVEIAHPRLFTLRSSIGGTREPKLEDRAAPANQLQLASTPIFLNIPVSPPLAAGTTLGGSSSRAVASRPKNSGSQPGQRVKSEASASTDGNVTPLGKRQPAGAIDGEVADSTEEAATANAFQRLEMIDSNETVNNGNAEVSIVRPSEPSEASLVQVERIPSKGDQPPNVSEPVGRVASYDARTVAVQIDGTSRLQSVVPTAAPSAVQERVLRPGPLSILISQRDQRMYVRKGFEPLFDFPIAIARTGRQLGTHVFTAVAPTDDGATLRWTVVSMTSTLPAMPTRGDGRWQSLAAAKEALDRIELPHDAVERVSKLMSVGATLIITDQGLGRSATALDSDYMVTTR